MAAQDIARRLAERIVDLVDVLLPGGHREGHEWRRGNVAGESGPLEKKQAPSVSAGSAFFLRKMMQPKNVTDQAKPQDQHWKTRLRDNRCRQDRIEALALIKDAAEELYFDKSKTHRVLADDLYHALALLDASA